MPYQIPSVGQFLNIKRLQTTQTVEKSLDLKKFRIPTGYGSVQGFYTKFGANALLSNKFIIPPEAAINLGPGGTIQASVTATSSVIITQIVFIGTLTINWGDDIIETFNSNILSGSSFSHNYATSSTYLISVSIAVGYGYITSFDVSDCTPLTTIGCVGNINLSSLNVANTRATSITASSCNLSTIANLDSIKTYLVTLNLRRNPIVSLNLNGYSALTVLNIENTTNNSLTSLVLQNCESLLRIFAINNANLQVLDLRVNTPAVNTLTIRGCTNLATLYIGGTQLNAINTIGTNTSPTLNPLIVGTVTMTNTQASVYPGNDPAAYYASALPLWTFIVAP